MTDSYKDWHKKFPFTLWGYWKSIRTSAGAILYSLVYRMDVVLPIEVEIPSLRILAECEVSEFDWLRKRYEELALMDKKRLSALNHIRGYQKRIARAFDKKVRSRKLAKGNLVLKELKAPIYDPRGKFKPNWVGPYIVKMLLSGGATYLMNLDGVEFKQSVNIDCLKKHYA